MSRATAVIAAVAAIGIAIAGFSAMASAHARVKSSSPAKGEVVQTSPSQVEIFFTQAVQKVAGTYGLAVGRDRGADVTAGPAVIDENDRTHMTVRLQPNLNPGRYVVQWKNVSDEDGNPAEGAFSFYIRSQPNAVNLQNNAQFGADRRRVPGAGRDGKRRLTHDRTVYGDNSGARHRNAGRGDERGGHADGDQHVIGRRRRQQRAVHHPGRRRRRGGPRTRRLVAVHAAASMRPWRGAARIPGEGVAPVARTRR